MLFFCLSLSLSLFLAAASAAAAALAKLIFVPYGSDRTVRTRIDKVQNGSSGIYRVLQYSIFHFGTKWPMKNHSLICNLHI